MFIGRKAELEELQKRYGVQHFNEFRIDPLRESLVILEIRANLLNLKVRHILQKDDGVRISH